MHGGALGSGAPTNERNGAWRHGQRTQETIALRRELADWLRLLRVTSAAVGD